MDAQEKGWNFMHDDDDDDNVYTSFVECKVHTTMGCNC